MIRLRMLSKICVLLFTFLLLSTIVGCTSSGARIKTSIGNLTIIKAETADKLPSTEQRAKDGYQLLLVWLEGDTNKRADLTTEGVYIIGDDGSETHVAVSGVSMLEEETSELKFLLGFTPPITAKTFTLYWPDNPPVELVLSK
jgi:hypothetical protein